MQNQPRDPSTTRRSSGRTVRVADIRQLQVTDDDTDIAYVSIVVVRALVHALRDLGYRHALFELEDIDLAAPTELALGVSRRLLGRMLERVAAERNDPVLGLSMARNLSVKHFHVAGLLITNAETGRQAIEWFMLLRRTLLGGPAWKLVEEDGPVARLGFEASLLPGSHIQAQLGIALVYRFMSHFWGPSVESALEVRFAGPAPRCPEQYRPLFGPRARFDAERNELVFPRVLLDTRRPQADTALASALHGFVVQTYAEATVPQIWSRRVRNALGNTEDLRDISTGALAESLHTSGRTLRRRLAAEGTSLRALLVAARAARRRATFR